MTDGNTNGLRVERRSLGRTPIAVVDLPFPPSTNHLFPTMGTRRIPSKEYAAWKEAAGWEIKRQRPRCTSGPVEIVITLAEQSRRMDLDNRIKAALDLIVSYGIIDGDHNKIVRKISAQWGDVSGAHVEIFQAPEWVIRREIGRATPTSGGAQHGD